MEHVMQSLIGRRKVFIYLVCLPSDVVIADKQVTPDVMILPVGVVTAY